MSRIKITGNFRIEGVQFLEQMEQPLEYLEFELNSHASDIQLIKAKSIVKEGYIQKLHETSKEIEQQCIKTLLSKECIAILLYLREYYPKYLANKQIVRSGLISDWGIGRECLGTLMSLGLIKANLSMDTSVLTEFGKNTIDRLVAIKEGKI